MKGKDSPMKGGRLKGEEDMAGPFACILFAKCAVGCSALTSRIILSCRMVLTFRSLAPTCRREVTDPVLTQRVAVPEPETDNRRVKNGRSLAGSSVEVEEEAEILVSKSATRTEIARFVSGTEVACAGL
eukprot:2601915-Rhodomonas_salina.1